MHINQKRCDDINRVLTPQLIAEGARATEPPIFSAKYVHAVRLHGQGQSDSALRLLYEIYHYAGANNYPLEPDLKEDAQLLALDIIRAQNTQPGRPLHPLAMELSTRHPFGALLRAQYYASQTPCAMIEAFAWLHKAIHLQYDKITLPNGDFLADSDEDRLYQAIVSQLMPGDHPLVLKLNALHPNTRIDAQTFTPEETKILTLMFYSLAHNQESVQTSVPAHRYPTTLNRDVHRRLNWAQIPLNPYVQLAYLSYALSLNLNTMFALQRAYNANKNSHIKAFFVPTFAPFLGFATRRMTWSETARQSRAPDAQGVAQEVCPDIFWAYLAFCWYAPYYPTVLPLYGLGRLLDYVTVLPWALYNISGRRYSDSRYLRDDSILTPYNGLRIAPQLIFSLITSAVGAILHIMLTMALLIVTCPLMLLTEVVALVIILLAKTGNAVDRLFLLAFSSITKTDTDIETELKKALEDPRSAINQYIRKASGGDAEPPPAYDVAGPAKTPSAAPNLDQTPGEAPPAYSGPVVAGPGRP